MALVGDNVGEPHGERRGDVVMLIGLDVDDVDEVDERALLESPIGV